VEATELVTDRYMDQGSQSHAGGVGRSAGVQIRKISKAFKTGETTLDVLDELSLDADSGDFVAILGPSGSGKSTTLGVLAGLVEPDSGTFDAPPPSELAYVFQDPRLLKWRTVEENLEIARAARRRDRPNGFDRTVAEYLDIAGLGDYGRYYPSALSGGMQQRASIARALSVEPSVLLMDEPFSALDELTAREQRAYLSQLWERERPTVLFVTHNVLEAITMATSVVVVSARPARVIEQISIDLPQPRRLNSPKAVELQQHILGLLGVDDADALA
jgi:ABC-type nitrate/sulfonate/bicarbonate transport system ATPase subunit